jgi:hypothetical protein
MRKRFVWVTFALLTFAVTITSWKAENTNLTNKAASANTTSAVATKQRFAQYIEDIYNTAQLNSTGLNFTVFQKAVTGYFNLKASNKVSPYSSVITIIDLAKSSCTKRLWIVDLVNKELLLKTLVAHGNGSGDDIAYHFSNENDSHASSIGFYITDNVYHGKHGQSLKLDGMDAGYNDNARARSIVVHGAKYVSEGTINVLNRLGHSEGCPAVPQKVVAKVINTIKGKTVMFINGNDDNYTSKYLDEDVAAAYVYPGNNQLNASL